jgi:EAL domain-containing protein (putative c-di-GMP-specific phosphodiesterase class I)
MMDNPESRKIVEAIVGLGRSMGLTTVAEGIEREDQRAAVSKLGCKIGQGYIFAKAMPADQVLGFMSALDQAAKAPAHEKRLAIVS